MNAKRREWFEDPQSWVGCTVAVIFAVIFGVGLAEVLILAVKVVAVAVALLSDAGNAWLREVLR
jgi:hypothetical protein